MTDEVKEILEDIKEIYYFKPLLDYITNLQKRLDFMIDRNDEKQERINKAIEYIEENCIDDEFYINLTNKEKHIIIVLNMLLGDE